MPVKFLTAGKINTVRPKEHNPGTAVYSSSSARDEDGMDHPNDGGDARDNSDDEEDAVKAKNVKMEYQPTREEVEQHMVSHYPFRPWCRHCVRGKAKGKLLRRIKEKVKYKIPIQYGLYVHGGEG